MKIALFILIGIIVGYIAKDLMTKESEITYIIKKLRAKKGSEIQVDGTAVVEKKKEKKTRRLFKGRKNKE